MEVATDQALKKIADPKGDRRKVPQSSSGVGTPTLLGATPKVGRVPS